MNRIKLFVAAAALLVVAVSCSEENAGEAKKNGIPLIIKF
jgi:hypothetical protein